MVGYNDPQFGRSGVEALQIRYLLGYNNPSMRRIYQKIFMTREVGNTLYLTIDADLQQYADDILESIRVASWLWTTRRERY